MTRDDLEQVVEELVDRVDELEDENEQLRERIETLEERPSFERRENDKNGEHIEEYWLDGLPFGPAIQHARDDRKELREDFFDLEDRVDALERGELDPSDLIDRDGSENDLEIQRATAARKAGNHDLSANKYRATFIWPKFHQHAQASNGQLILSSWQVRNFLEEADLDTNPATVRRVMRHLATMTSEKPPKQRDPEDEDNLVTFSSGSGENTLRANKDEWLSFFNQQIEEVVQSNQDDLKDDPDDEDNEDDQEDEDGAADEFDQLLDGEAVTSSDEDSVSGNIGGRGVDE